MTSIQQLSQLINESSLQPNQLSQSRQSQLQTQFLPQSSQTPHAQQHTSLGKSGHSTSTQEQTKITPQTSSHSKKLAVHTHGLSDETSRLPKTQKSIMTTTQSSTQPPLKPFPFLKRNRDVITISSSVNSIRKPISKKTQAPPADKCSHQSKKTANHSNLQNFQNMTVMSRLGNRESGKKSQPQTKNRIALQDIVDALEFSIPGISEELTSPSDMDGNVPYSMARPHREIHRANI